uniref:Uncharacterized protein MANES_18G061300 n=1 Tax=Rhizophora mucronata TaxID=61149 RepID=A0A2P2PAP9_RHIMU
MHYPRDLCLELVKQMNCMVSFIICPNSGRHSCLLQTLP